MDSVTPNNTVAGLVEKLLPCPFCGSSASRGEYDTSRGDAFVVCCSNRDCHADVYTDSDSREAADAAWNRRASPAPSAGVGDDAIKAAAMRCARHAYGFWRGGSNGSCEALQYFDGGYVGRERDAAMYEAEIRAALQHPAAPSVSPSVAGDAGELPDLLDSIADDTRGHSLNGDQHDGLRNAANLIRRLATAEQPESWRQHSDDKAVDRFAAAMKEKLATKRAEGYSGWDAPDECTVEHLSNLLHKHVRKGDPVDVGNFAMMLHQRGSGILPEQPGSAVQGEVPLQERMDEYANGTFICPMCGQSGPHTHPPKEVLIYRNGVKYGRSLAGAPPAPAAEQAYHGDVPNWNLPVQPEARGVEGMDLKERGALIRKMNYMIWMQGDGGCEPPQDWQDGYNAALAAAPEPVRVDAYAAGWRNAAKWASRDDLISDIGSPAYERDKAATPTGEDA